METTTPAPETSASAQPAFVWAIYADATLAALAELIPLPFVDSAFERFFRRRMVYSIARQRSRPLHPAAVRALHAPRLSSTLGAIALAPFHLLVKLGLRLFRKLVYFLAVKSAVDALTYYWRRAYLLDHMVRRGHLSGAAAAPAAVAALETVLAESDGGPLRWLAQEVVEHTHQVLRVLWQARRGREAEPGLSLRSYLAEHWPDLGDSLTQWAHRYDELYETLRREDGLRTQQRSWPGLQGGLQQG